MCNTGGRFSHKMAPSLLHIVPSIRALVLIAYFALTLFLYARAPSGLPSTPSHHHDHHHHSKSLGLFGDMMVAMLGPTDAPFTLFVPSHAAFLNTSSTFRTAETSLDPTDTESPAYAVMSHLLSFSAVPKRILSKHVPVGKEVVVEALSGLLISLTNLPGRGLVANNVSCNAVDLERGRFVIHVLDGALMDFEFEQSMLQEAAAEDEDPERG